MKTPSFWQNWKRRVSDLKREVAALALALRHPDTPLAAKVAAFFVVAYALSPLDLVPDFIPVLGLLDDLLLLPLGILLVRRMVPKAVLDECRQKAASGAGSVGLYGAVMVIFLWTLLAVAAVLALVRAV